MVLALLTLSGCVSIHVRQQFNPSGSSSVLQQIYVGQALDTLAAAGLRPPPPYPPDRQGWSDYIDSVCANVGSEEPGASCHRNGPWLLIDQMRTPGTDYLFNSFESFPYTIYDLTVFQMPQPPLRTLERIGVEHISLGRNFTSANVTAADQSFASGLRYTYLVQMPGDITNFTSGRPVEGGVEISVLSQMRSRQIVKVRSRAINFEQLALIIIIFLDVLLFIDVVLIWAVQEYRRRKAAYDRKKREREEGEARKRVFRKVDRKRSPFQVYESLQHDEEDRKKGDGMP